MFTRWKYVSLCALGTKCLWIRCFADFFSVQNIYCTLRPHDSNLGTWPCKIHVGSDVFGTHDDERSAVGLPCHQRDERDRCFSVGIEQFGAVANDSVPLLFGAWQESWHVHQCHNRDAKGVAESEESRGLLTRID